MTLKTLLLFAIVGITAAFFRPAQPHQAPAAVEIPRGGGFPFEAKATKPFIDDDLDNFNIEADEAITAARKCGFCMVSKEKWMKTMYIHLLLKIDSYMFAFVSIFHSKARLLTVFIFLVKN